MVEAALDREEPEGVLEDYALRYCRSTGPGAPLSPEELRGIFKRFYRADRARAMDHSYGLGLSIARSIVARHGGRIWAESREGGNVFFVELPAHPLNAGN